jgi:tetraacyldisaccharide 4'-kinase
MTSKPPLEKSALLTFLYAVRTNPWLFPVSFALRVFSWVFFLICFVRKLGLRLIAFCSAKSTVPVISVGSVTLGGAGKTPVLLFLMKKVALSRIAYVSRGYGRPEKEDIISYGCDIQRSTTVGDEAFLLARRIPSLLLGIGTSKRKMIKKLSQKTIDILFLDDGLQRYDIPAQCEIGVLPESLLFEPEKLFPLGLLREPIGRLRKVDLLFVIKENPFTSLGLMKEKLKRFSFDRYVIAEQQISGWLDVQGAMTVAPLKKLVLFSAIARPERVMTLLKSLGYEIRDTFFLRDHETLLSKKFSEWANYWNRKGVSVIGTEKDWARHVPWPKDLYFCTFLQVDLSLLMGEDVLYSSCFKMWL